MPRWSPDAALRLEMAALTLFERDGYTQTTVPQITAAAGLTTRTFFRHFANKRDVMFLRDGEFPTAIQDALRDVAAETSPADTVLQGLLAACDDLEGWRTQFARRKAVINAEPALIERDLLSNRHLAAGIEAALLTRGADQEHAQTLSAFAVTGFELAVDRWLEDDSGATLGAHFLQVWRSVPLIMGDDASAVQPAG